MDTERLGLKLVLDFISIEEESEILSNIDPPKKTTKSKLMRNSVKRYGSSLPYDNDIVSNKIPKYLDNISTKILKSGYLPIRPDSISINEYLKGNSIAPHIDSKSSGDIITVLSLLSDTKMVFDRDGESFSIVLPRRSLVQLRDEIRYEWRHSVPPVSNNRYSIVFRMGT